LYSFLEDHVVITIVINCDLKHATETHTRLLDLSSIKFLNLDVLQKTAIDFIPGYFYQHSFYYYDYCTCFGQTAWTAKCIIIVYIGVKTFRSFTYCCCLGPKFLCEWLCIFCTLQCWLLFLSLIAELAAVTNYDYD